MKIETVGVAGLGLLGRGIAACLLGHGVRVIAFTRRQETHDQAKKYGSSEKFVGSFALNGRT